MTANIRYLDISPYSQGMRFFFFCTLFNGKSLVIPTNMWLLFLVGHGHALLEVKATLFVLFAFSSAWRGLCTAYFGRA